MTIGVTGGVGAGKSLVLEYLEEECGAKILMMDEIGRRLMRPGTPVTEEIIRTFGAQAVLPDGTLDRAELARQIFHDPKAKEKLNAIVHPAVRAEVEAQIAQSAPDDLLVLESAILIEAGYHRLCDSLWYVYAPKEVRIRRLAETRGYIREKAESIMRSQLGDDAYRSYADVVIDNSGSFEDTKRQIREVLGL